MTQLIKNDDGSFTYGDVAILAPVYSREKKKHIFNILRNGSIPAVHYGNHITFRNAIKGIVEGMTPPVQELVIPLDETAPVEAVEAPSEASEASEVYQSTDPVIVALKASLASGSDDDYWAFKAILDQEIINNRLELSIL